MSTWAVYDDDKPVEEISWEDVAKRQAYMLFWNRRHPRQHPLPNPAPCVFPIQKSAEPCCALSVTLARDTSANPHPPPTHPDDHTIASDMCTEDPVTVSDDLAACLPVLPLQLEDPTLPTGDPSLHNGNPTLPTEDPTLPTGDPTSHSSNPTLPTEDPSLPTGDPSLHNGNPTLPTEDPTSHAGHPTSHTEDPTSPTADPTLRTGELASLHGGPASYTGDPASPLPAPPSFTEDQTATLIVPPAHYAAPNRASELHLSHQLPELGQCDSSPHPYSPQGGAPVSTCPPVPSPSRSTPTPTSSTCVGVQHDAPVASSSCNLPLQYVHAQPSAPVAGTQSIALPSPLPITSNASSAVGEPGAFGPIKGKLRKGSVGGKTLKGLSKGKAPSSPSQGRTQSSSSKGKAHSRSTRGRSAACPSKGRAATAPIQDMTARGLAKIQGPSQSTRSKAGSASCKGKAGTGPTTGTSHITGGQQNLSQYRCIQLMLCISWHMSLASSDARQTHVCLCRGGNACNNNMSAFPFYRNSSTVIGHRANSSNQHCHWCQKTTCFGSCACA